MNGFLRAFTLIELLLVVAIMGLLGTISAGGYAALTRGIEERGVMQNVDEFVHNAYQRAAIDRQPVAIYFWNETRREESDKDTLVVIGRAVAVRRHGRLSYVQGNQLCDEFGDWRYARHLTKDASGNVDETGFSDQGQNDTMYLYRINGDESSFQRSIVNATAVQLTRPAQSLLDGQIYDLPVYAYVAIDKGGIDWKVGDAYAMEFNDLALPDNYIFGSGYSASASSPVHPVSEVMKFDSDGGGAGSTIAVSAIRPDKSGAMAVVKIQDSKAPGQY